MKFAFDDTKTVEERLRFIERLASAPDDGKTELTLEAIRHHASMALRKMQASQD